MRYAGIPLCGITKGREFDLVVQEGARHPRWETVGRLLRTQTATVGFWNAPSWVWLRRYIADAKWLKRTWMEDMAVRVIRRYDPDAKPLWDSEAGSR